MLTKLCRSAGLFYAPLNWMIFKYWYIYTVVKIYVMSTSFIHFFPLIEKHLYVTFVQLCAPLSLSCLWLSLVPASCWKVKKAQGEQKTNRHHKTWPEMLDMSGIYRRKLIYTQRRPLGVINGDRSIKIHLRPSQVKCGNLRRFFSPKVYTHNSCTCAHIHFILTSHYTHSNCKPSN